MVAFQDSIEGFHEAAAAERGLEDFGSDDYRAALEILCTSLDEDARLTPMGDFAFREMIVDALSARLRVEAGHRQFPAASEVRIDRPLVIVGLPRTGTTALHHLLAQDPGLQSLEHWLQRAPKPRPPKAEWAGDADFVAAAERLRMIYERSPEMRAIHEIEADLPDECWNLFSQNFAHCSWQANADVHSYAGWWSTCDMTPVYERHRRNAQLIGVHDTARRWLFKDATHLFDLDALLAVYPDAMIVQTHRDPVKLIPSVCSLCWASRSPLNEGGDAVAFGQSTLGLWERGIASMMRAREGRDAKQFYDLAFSDFVRDPLEAIRRIYAYFALDLTEEAVAGIRSFRAANPAGKHGDHSYSADGWGLDPAEIRERFAVYAARYSVELG